MRDDGQHEAGKRREDLDDPASRHRGDADADAGADREHRVCERRQQAAADEGCGQPLLPVLDPGDREVLDVLGEREPGSGDSGIDHAVGDAVELALGETPHEEHEQPLRSLLDERRDEHGGEGEGLLLRDGSPEHEPVRPC